MANENERDSNGLVWAVVDTGTRRLLGLVGPNTMPGDLTTVAQALELQCQLIHVPTPQGMAEMYHPSMHPVDLEDDPVTLQVQVANIRFLDKMGDKGARYHALREHLLQQLLQARAQRSGLDLTGQMPKGGLIRGH